MRAFRLNVWFVRLFLLLLFRVGFEKKTCFVVVVVVEGKKYKKKHVFLPTRTFFFSVIKPGAEKLRF